MGSPKTVFLTGATGFLGSNLAYELFRHGYKLKLLIREKEVAAEVRLEKSLRYLIEEPAEYQNFCKHVEVIPGDLTFDNLGVEPSILTRLQSEVDIIFHNAALTNFSEPYEKLEKQNVSATRNVLDFKVRLKNSAFHYVSTAYVCGQAKGVFFENDLDKGQTFNNPYEETKLKAEQLIREYEGKYSFTSTIYRPSIVVGDSVSGKTSNFLGVYSFIKAIYFLVDMFTKDLSKGGGRAETANVSYRDNKLHIPLRIPANPKKTLNIVPVDYLIAVILTALTRQDPSGGVFHIINPSPPSIEELNHALRSIFNISGPTIVRHEEFQSKPMTDWETFFLESIQDVTPYLAGNAPVFAETNTQNLLAQKKITCPQISGELLSRLISFYVKTLRYKG